MPDARGDQGRSRSMSGAVCELVLRAKREKPRRSIRRIIALLERAKLVRKGELSSSSVHRLLAREGQSARPARGAEDEAGHALGTKVERRSYIAEHVGDLWVGDALHVHRRVRFPSGRVGKAYLLSQIDSASRYVPHSYLAEHEQEHGFRQAISKYGVPRVYYVDRGAAYVAGSLAAICAELGAVIAIWQRGSLPGGGKLSEAVSAEPAVVTPQARVSISLLFGSEKQDWLEAVSRDFASAHPEIKLELTARGSLESAQAILEGTAEPTLFSPADSLALRLLERLIGRRSTSGRSLPRATTRRGRCS